MSAGFEHIQAVKGVGDSTIEAIEEAGFESEEEIARLSADELADAVSGIGRTTAHNILYELDRHGYRVDTEVQDNLAELQALLSDLFRFEHSDRNFGIYRILNKRREAVERFIDTQLVDVVQEAVDAFRKGEASQLRDQLQAERERITRELDEDAFTKTGTLKEEYQSFGITEDYQRLKRELQEAESSKLKEADIYNDIFQFFDRYFQDGDFVPIRRRGQRSKYAVPYDGAETYFHWANRNQYYTKTSEHYHTYSFEAEGATVVFDTMPVVLEDAKTSSRFFVPSVGESLQVDATAGEVRVQFEHRKLTADDLDEWDVSSRSQSKQATLNERLVDWISDAAREHDLPVSTEKLASHLDSYTTKHTSDYFIHKDLESFLERELEQYIQTEVLEIDPAQGTDVTEAQLRKARVVQTVAQNVITFLGQVEAFQKQLYKKQKFVTESEHLIPVGRLPENTYGKLLANDEQQGTWAREYHLEIPIDEDDLARRPTILVDTQHFDRETTIDLLDAAKDPDEGITDITNGRLIKGDNYHAMRLLRERYREEISCIYIDPPYNTGDDEFLYKDNYQHSSWLAMMADRLELAHTLLADDGVIFISIDENEMARLRLLMDEIFGSENLLAELVWDLNNSATQGHFYRSHEYILAFAKNKQALPNFDYDPTLEKFPAAGSELIEHNAIKRMSKKNPPSEIEFPAGIDFEGGSAVFEDEISGRESIEIVDGPMVFEDGELAEPVTLRAGWAMKDQILEWLDKGEAFDSKGQRVRRFFFNRNGKLRYEKERGTMHPRTVLRSGTEGDLFSSTQAGTRELEAVLGEAEVDYPKPVDLIKHLIGINTSDGDIVMDFFAGSGTTGQAAIELNQQRDATIEYLLVEISDLFESTVKPRLKRCYYTPEWSDGEPVEDPGAPQQDLGAFHSGDGGDFDLPLITYETLETYQQSLDAIQFSDEPRSLSSFEEYTIQYMLNFETRDSPPMVDLDQFEAPFEYTLDAQPRGEIPVDLPATFNHLLGVAVDSIDQYTHEGTAYYVVEGSATGTGDLGASDEHESVLIIWRTDEEVDYETEREFLTSSIIPERDVDTVYMNHDSAVAEVRSLQRPFVARMFGGVERGHE